MGGRNEGIALIVNEADAVYVMRALRSWAKGKSSWFFIVKTLCQGCSASLASFIASEVCELKRGRPLLFPSVQVVYAWQFELSLLFFTVLCSLLCLSLCSAALVLFIAVGSLNSAGSLSLSFAPLSVLCFPFVHLLSYRHLLKSSFHSMAVEHTFLHNRFPIKQSL